MDTQIQLFHGDCLAVMPTLEANSIDTIITDPPYGYEFMGKDWDKGIPGEVFWREMLRVAKPGAILMAFGGTRTYHRLACAIEDAGWEIRDCVMWLYGSGFPKSTDISKQLDKRAGAERTEVIGVRVRNVKPFDDDNGWNANSTTGYHEYLAPATPLARQWEGWGTALKPAWEPIIVAQKPVEGTYAANAEKWGVAGLWIDGGRVGTSGATSRSEQAPYPKNPDGTEDRSQSWARTGHNVLEVDKGRWPANLILDEITDIVARLRYNIPEEVSQLIQEYYRDYQLPTMRDRDASTAVKSATKEVLQPGMLRPLAEREPQRGKSSHARQAPHAGIQSEDERGGTGECATGGKSVQLEGREAHIAGLCDASAQHSFTEGTGAIWFNGDAKRGEFDAGASASNGASPGAGVGSIRSGASHQRGEGRQPARESRDARQRNPQAGALENNEGVAGVARGKRTLEVLAGDIPEGWMKYFEDTGREVVVGGSAAILDEQSGETASQKSKRKSAGQSVGNKITLNTYKMNSDNVGGYDDKGGASRFFYCAKASRSERGEDNIHPTVKPLAVMQYLCRLTKTPTGGTVLDPFMGSGSTGVASLREGRSFIGIEIDTEHNYFEIAKARIEAEQQRIEAEQDKPRTMAMELSA